jgi:hypothetical protein
LGRLRDRTIEQGDFLSLLPLFDRSSIKESTDARDQVYAMLGISDVPDESELAPNYALSIQKTYGRVCQWFLSQTREGPKILSLVGLPRSRSQLPSWVPDFSTIKVSSTLYNQNVSYNAGSAGVKRYQTMEDLQVLVA